MKILFVVGLVASVFSSYAQQELSIEDSRNLATAPTFYNYKLKGSFKFNNVLGVPSTGLFSTIIGLRGWGDDSGGKAHELAFADQGLYLRSGYDSGWEGWRKFILAHTNGNVGIGTSTPSSLLHVNGQIRSKKYVIVDDNNNNVEIGSGGVLVGGLGSTPLRRTIHYEIASQWDASQIQLRAGSTFEQTLIRVQTDWNGTGLDNKGGIYFGLKSADKHVMLSNGNVGFGTLEPQERLSVNGNIRAKEIKVEATNWPDYVFKPDYTLMPLKEVEHHIKTHGHLPGIPKAEQIEQDGLSVSEMNKLMMKKIEELTLHLIEKDKEVQELKQRLQTVENNQKEKLK